MGLWRFSAVLFHSGEHMSQSYASHCIASWLWTYLLLFAWLPCLVANRGDTAGAPDGREDGRGLGGGWQGMVCALSYLMTRAASEDEIYV